MAFQRVVFGFCMDGHMVLLTSMLVFMQWCTYMYTVLFVFLYESLLGLLSDPMECSRRQIQTTSLSLR